jgi:glutamyl-tRNA reductase
MGTGESAAQVAKTLNKKEVPYDVASRTLDRATGFSTVVGGTPVNFDDALAGLDKYDIVFVATIGRFRQV